MKHLALPYALAPNFEWVRRMRPYTDGASHKDTGPRMTSDTATAPKYEPVRVPRSSTITNSTAIQMHAV